MAQDNMDHQNEEEESNLNMQSSSEKNKKLNIPMVFLSDNFQIFLSVLPE